MRTLKPLLTLCLCLAMIVTSVTGAFARGQMAFGQTLQICAEGEPLSITLDARGNSVNASHTCPDCLAVTAGLPPSSIEFAQPSGRWLHLYAQKAVTLATQTTLHAFARGPPALI